MVKLRIWKDGNKYWVLNGGLHRSNGPAVIYASGHSSWYWYSNWVSEFEHMMVAASEMANG